MSDDVLEGNLLQHILNTENVVTIGGFDGVHIGHQTILKKTVEIAKKKNLESLALTFYPLPKVFFDTTRKTKEILDLETKEKIILELGINHLYALEFYNEFANIEAEYFLKKILIESLKTKVLVVGYDFRFGKNRKTGVAELQNIIQKIPNFELVVIPKIEIQEDFPNSTKIRKYLKQKEYNKASKLLGWDYKTFKSTNEIIFNKTSLVAKQSPSAS